MRREATADRTTWLLNLQAMNLDELEVHLFHIITPPVPVTYHSFAIGLCRHMLSSSKGRTEHHARGSARTSDVVTSCASPPVGHLAGANIVMDRAAVLDKAKLVKSGI